MLLELPPGTPAIYWGFTSVNLYVNLFCVVLFIIFGLLLIVSRKNDDAEIFKKIKRGYGLFAVCYAMCRLFFIFGVWFSDLYELYTMMAYIWVAVGIECIIVVIENYMVTKTKHVFTVFGLIVIALLFIGVLGIIAQDVARTISTLGSPVMLVLLAILYIYIAVTGTASVRRKAILMIVAMVLIGGGAILDSEDLVVEAATWFGGDILMLEIFYSITPIILMIGIIIFYSTMRK